MKKPEPEVEPSLVVGRTYFRYDGGSLREVSAVEDGQVRWRDELGPGRSSEESFRKLFPTPAPETRVVPSAHDPRSKEFTLRDEANALTALAFRNGFLEELHAGKHSALLEEPGLSRITDQEMRRLMIETSEMLARLLRLEEADPERYRAELRAGHEAYCRKWDRD
jgi:hypothetical protein